MQFKWCPACIISGSGSEIDGYDFACIVLNRNVSVPADVARNIWQNASIRCTVDGGTDRWRTFIEQHCQGYDMKDPDFITGDFDSISEESAQYFKKSSITKQIHTPDQNQTDFTKALMVLQRMLEKQAVGRLRHFIVFQDTSGRLDQIMANINTLYRMSSVTAHVYLLGGNSLSWLLLPGRHSIEVPKQLVKEQRWCALLPIGCRANCVTTTGLKWNLESKSMEFGGLVSTSNTYAEELVTVETGTPLIWSMGLFNSVDSD